MSPKNAATAALLMFVAASIVVLTVKSLRIPPQNEASAGQTAAEGSAKEPARGTPTPADGVIAYYMHGKVRCPTCVSIEEYAHEAVAQAAARARMRLVS